MTTYYALVADVVASRYLTPTARARLQEALKRSLPGLNQRWASVLAARFAITMGDELQCLLHTSAAIWPVSHAIRRTFSTVDWIVACGRGPLTTPLTADAAAPELDGPCFHAARRAMDRGKEERLVLAVEGFDERSLDGVSRYYAALYWGWTRRQRLAANDWRAMTADSEATLTQKRRGRSDPSAVSHLRKRMAWPLVESGDRMFQALLEAS
jgi:arylamine N-acetyltransferase